MEPHLHRTIARRPPDASTATSGRARESSSCSTVPASSFELDIHDVDLRRFVEDLVEHIRPGLGGHAAVTDLPEQRVGVRIDPRPGDRRGRRSRLFDRFHQARRAREPKGGLGLGLYISKGIVDAHGGELSVRSVVDVGSTFRLKLGTRAAIRPSDGKAPTTTDARAL